MTTFSVASSCEMQSGSPDGCLPEGLRHREQVQHILVIKLRHYGDVLLTTPLLSTLQINYPNALIELLVYGDTQSILNGYPHIDKTYSVDRSLKNKGGRAQFLGEKALWKTLRRSHYDLVINLSEQWRAALYARFLKPTFSIGFNYPIRNNHLWRACHSFLVNMGGHQQQHTVLNNLSILSPLRLPDKVTKVTQSYQQSDRDKARQLIDYYRLNDYVLVQPTARWAFKTWSASRFIQVINHLTAAGETVVLSAGKSQSEINILREIEAGCLMRQRVVNLAGSLELSTLAALIDQAKLFIGVDSAPMHMAAALKTPCVVLFGPSNLAQWSPWQVAHTMLWAGNYRVLPQPNEVDTDTDERYLDAIPVTDVINAIDNRLKLLSSAA